MGTVSVLTWGAGMMETGAERRVRMRKLSDLDDDFLDLDEEEDYEDSFEE